jgi:hypothetical protein
MVSQPRLHRPCQKFPTRHHEWVRTAHQPRSTGFRAGTFSRGVTTPVPRVYLPISLTAPGPSGSPEPTRLCRGCSHPPRRPPDQAASSFTSPLRRRRNGRSLTSIRKQQQRLVAHTNRTESRRSVTVSGVNKIGGQQPGGLGMQEAAPSGVCSAWCRSEVGGGQDPVDCACVQVVSASD